MSTGMKEGIKERMLGKLQQLHRHKFSSSFTSGSASPSSDYSNKSGERIDFCLSNIRALQVPKGWEKLYVSLVSLETGKTVAKSRKAVVRNGNCLWTETLSESIWISQNVALRELEQHLYKLLVSTGSAKSGILGETTINLWGCMSAKTSVPLSLPLKKCNYGTILKVDIQCLTPRTDMRDKKWDDINSHIEDANAYYGDMDNKSDISGSTFTSSHHLGSASHPGVSRETSFSASGSHHSSDSIEDSFCRESFSHSGNLSGIINKAIGRQDSNDSQNSAPISPCTVYNSPRSNHPSKYSRIPSPARTLQNQRDLRQNSQFVFASPTRNSGSSKTVLESEEVTIEELTAEARMWERNARKLMHDLEMSRKEFADQSKHLENLDMELSATRMECDGLKQQVQHLKIQLEQSLEKQENNENLIHQAKDMDNIRKELEDEIVFQKQSNDDLARQLKKTQVSNVELVSVLQEMEETIEAQKAEIENFVSLKLQSSGAGKGCIHEDKEEIILMDEISAEKASNAISLSDVGGSPVEKPLPDVHKKFQLEDRWYLQLQQFQESQQDLENTILGLKKSLEEKNREIEIAQDLLTKSLQDCEAEWRGKLTTKEQAIVDLEARLSNALSTQDAKVSEIKSNSDANLVKEIEALIKERNQELASDCHDHENLELHFDLKESRSYSSYFSNSTASFDSSSNDGQSNYSLSTSDSEVSKLRSQIWQLKQELKKEGVTTNHLQIQCNDLEIKCSSLELELQNFKDQVCCRDGELENYRAKFETQEIELDALRQKLQCHQGEIIKSKAPQADVCAGLKKSTLQTVINMCGLCPELSKQLELFLVNVEKQYILHVPGMTKCENPIHDSDALQGTNTTNQKAKAENFLHNLVHVNKLLGTKFSAFGGDWNSGEEDHEAERTNACEVQNPVKDDKLQENAPCSSLLNVELESRIEDLSKELLERNSEIRLLKAECLHKDNYIEGLRYSQREMESQISDLKNIKCKMEESMVSMQKQGKTASKCLDDLTNDMMAFNDCNDSHVSANKMLEKKPLELENEKHELELHVSELEEENIQSSEPISSLVAQLRYLTDERESNRLEPHHSQSHARTLQDKITRFAGEIEAQMVDMKQKLTEMQNRWLEAQEECEYLKKANPKLQAMAESLKEECSSLQKSNGELPQQRLEFYKYCTVLEAALWKSENALSDCQKKIEALEAKFTSMLDEVFTKEKLLDSELEALHHQNKEKNEKLVLEEELLSEMYKEKAIEVENLEQEVERLIGQISGTRESKDIEASQPWPEILASGAKKDKLEAAIQKVQEKLGLSDKKLRTVQVECERNVLGLMNELAVSNQNKEIPTAKNEELLGLSDDVRSDENKLKAAVDELESKLKLSKVNLSEVEENSTIPLSEYQQMGTEQLQQLIKGQDNQQIAPLQIWVDKKSSSFPPDLASRILFLENELAESLEANEMYKSQLRRLLLDGPTGTKDAPSKQSRVKISREENEHKASALEAELTELREGYFHMSLKYAEVEAQREQLVMELKAARNGRI